MAAVQYFFHSTTNQKHAGVTEGGSDRPHNRARTFREHNGNNEGNEYDNNEYGKDRDIPEKPFDFFHAITNQKHAGVMEEEW